MRIQELLFERFVNLFSPEEKKKAMDEVWDLLELTYAEIGGLMGAGKENLIKTPGMWKLVRKEGKIIAGILYRDKKGRKIRLVLHNNTPAGKDWVKKIIKEDIAHGRSWGEVSGALEKVMIKLGAKPIPNTKAEEILGRSIKTLDKDGVHYTREIQPGDVKKQILLGKLEGW